MSVFDIAENMTPAATEQDEFSVIQITQPQMDAKKGRIYGHRFFKIEELEYDGF